EKYRAAAREEPDKAFKRGGVLWEATGGDRGVTPGCGGCGSSCARSGLTRSSARTPSTRRPPWSTRPSHYVAPRPSATSRVSWHSGRSARRRARWRSWPSRTWLTSARGSQTRRRPRHSCGPESSSGWKLAAVGPAGRPDRQQQVVAHQVAQQRVERAQLVELVERQAHERLHLLVRVDHHLAGG